MVSPSAIWPHSLFENGSSAIRNMGEVMTMRLNQHPRLVEALNSTMLPIE